VFGKVPTRICDRDRGLHLLILLALLSAPTLSGCPVAAHEQTKTSVAAKAVPVSGGPARGDVQADPGNGFRIYRPPGGFKHSPSRDDGEPQETAASSREGDGSARVFFAERVWADPSPSDNLTVDPAAPPFTQVLDGFSARWQHRLGTPAACAMVLCQGSCADSDAACELAGSWRGESAGCAAMPEGDSDCCAADKSPQSLQ